jgi:endo-1,4-beta-xylanase
MKPLLLILITVVTTLGQTLRQEADRAGILVSAAVRPAQLSEVAYASTLAREFNMLEAENDMKWQAIRPDQKTFDFTQADQVVGFARVHGMKIRGHTLVWGWSNPRWLNDQHFSPEQLSALLQEHITRVVSRYRAQVFAWDVINEAIDEHGHLRPSIRQIHRVHRTSLPLGPRRRSGRASLLQRWWGRNAQCEVGRDIRDG